MICPYEEVYCDVGECYSKCDNRLGEIEVKVEKCFCGGQDNFAYEGDFCQLDSSVLH